MNQLGSVFGNQCNSRFLSAVLTLFCRRIKGILCQGKLLSLQAASSYIGAALQLNMNMSRNNLEGNNVTASEATDVIRTPFNGNLVLGAWNVRTTNDSDDSI